MMISFLTKTQSGEFEFWANMVFVQIVAKTFSHVYNSQASSCFGNIRGCGGMAILTAASHAYGAHQRAHASGPAISQTSGGVSVDARM